MAALVLLALFVAMGVAVLLDLTPDTRDPEYGLGRVLESRTASAAESR
jgi:hypothetical protein